MNQCPECDRVFPSELGVRMHMLRVHQGMGPGHNDNQVEKIPCPECGKSYAPTYMIKHMNAKHRNNHPAVMEAPATSASFKVLPMVVLEDAAGGVWIAERIR